MRSRTQFLLASIQFAEDDNLVLNENPHPCKRRKDGAPAESGPACLPVLLLPALVLHDCQTCNTIF